MSAGFGVCVDILHVMGDTLYNIDKPIIRPKLGPSDILNSKDTINLENSKVDSLKNDIDKIEELPGLLESTKISEEKNIKNGEVDTNESKSEIKNNLNGPSDDDKLIDPVQEMDNLLEYCFLKACKTCLKKADLPIITSTFFKNHVISMCPTGSTVDVKKSSYKKLSVFLAKMKEKGLADTSVLKGVESLLSVQVCIFILKLFFKY